MQKYTDECLKGRCQTGAGSQKLEAVNADEEMDNNEVEPINKLVNHVNSDSSTEDECGEEDLNEVANQRGNSEFWASNPNTSHNTFSDSVLICFKRGDTWCTC